MINSLDVILWGEKVGTLVSVKDGCQTKVCFYFAPGFAKRGLDIAPLRASIKNEAYAQGIPVFGEGDKLFGGLPSFIADSLPDHWGSVLFREWAKSKNIRMRDLGPLDRLAYIGSRGMGALEFVPSAAPALETSFKVEVDELYRFSQFALSEVKSKHLEFSPEMIIENLFKVGTSAGGKRPKAVINVNFDEGICYSGQVAAPRTGFIPMIIKFDEGGRIPVTRIEYSYWLMAGNAGLNMMPSRLYAENDAVHFLTERFDREGSEKIHIQTLAAMNPSADSYEDLFDIARAIGVPSAEMEQLFLSMVMNVLGGNVDDHSKNFSFMMRKDGQWHIAPTYDYTFTIDLSAPWYVNGHSLSVNGKTDAITNSDLLEIGHRNGIRGAASIIEKSVQVVKNYPAYGEVAGVPQEWIGRISETINALVDNLD